MRVAVLGGDASLEVSDRLLAREFNGGLVHQLVEAHRANGRQGSRAQKSRAQVKHSTRKLFRQKGTGRARGGMSSSPIRVGGGRAFPSSPGENLGQKVNRKVFRAGMAMLLSALARERRLWAVASMERESPRTKEFVGWMDGLGISGRTLFVDTELDENFVRASRNIPRVSVSRLSGVGPTDLVRHDSVVFTERAIRRMEEVWA